MSSEILFGEKPRWSSDTRGENWQDNISYIIIIFLGSQLLIYAAKSDSNQLEANLFSWKYVNLSIEKGTTLFLTDRALSSSSQIMVQVLH